jgi:hypothetical protein
LDEEPDSAESVRKRLIAPRVRMSSALMEGKPEPEEVAGKGEEERLRKGLKSFLYFDVGELPDVGVEELDGRRVGVGVMEDALDSTLVRAESVLGLMEGERSAEVAEVLGLDDPARREEVEEEE